MIMIIIYLFMTSGDLQEFYSKIKKILSFFKIGFPCKNIKKNTRVLCMLCILVCVVCAVADMFCILRTAYFFSFFSLSSTISTLLPILHLVLTGCALANGGRYQD